MNDPNDADANEEAARRLQEQIWMADAGNDDEDDDDDDDDDGDNNNNAGAVQDFVRQLLDRDNNNDNDEEPADEANNDNGGDAGDDDDDDDDDEDDDEDADAIENRRGAIDGGIAGEVRDEHNVKITRSLKCPLVLYLETDEDLDDLCPHNPVMKRGTTVYIGIDKNTKLSLVFNQYCKFVNSKTPKKGKGAAKGTVDTDAVKTTDFEFLHCTLLDANQTVEASAMMKNDRIKVYRERSKERSSRGEVLRQQRESDRKYFRDLRQLLPNPSPEGMGCDIVLDCRGKVMDERGFSQNVLATTVRANSVLISKRCKWLGQKIFHEREDIRRRAEMTVPADEGKSDLNEEQEEDAADVKSGQSDDDDDIIMAEQVQAGGNNINNDIAGGDGSAAKVEDDEDEEPAAKVKVAKSPAKKAESHSSSWPNSIWVTLDHSPQAVKLLLEYCYTNRVPSLGQEAFLKASKYPNPKDVGVLAAKQAGPVPPFRKHEWPDTGSPTISLHLALAGIALAEEAHMPRLSLMCEIAASQLVDNKNVIDVLSACQVQQQKTGNRLPILRKAAMLDCIMANGSSGIDTLYANNSFRSNLEERGDVVIPSLLDGTVEVMPTNMNTKEIKRKLDKISLDKRRYFELNDGSDKNKRMMERVKRRKSAVVNRRMEVAYGPDKLALRMPCAQPKNIWRESYRRDPPPLNASGTSRGTKRKGSTRSTDGGAGASGSTRNVRRRQTRKKSNNLA